MIPFPKFIALFIVVFATSICLAQEHPAEAAERTLDDAQTQLNDAEKRFLKALENITEKEKREDAVKAYTARKHIWDRLMDADANLQIAASPAPDTSTSSSLIPLWTAARHIQMQVALIDEQTEWVLANWAN